MKSEYNTLLQFSPLRAGFTSVFAAVTGCVRTDTSHVHSINIEIYSIFRMKFLVKWLS